MPARRILVIYATRHGQTARIARHVAEQLRAQAHEVTLVDGELLPDRLEAQDWDAGLVSGTDPAAANRLSSRARNRFGSGIDLGNEGPTDADICLISEQPIPDAPELDRVVLPGGTFAVLAMRRNLASAMPGGRRLMQAQMPEARP